MIVNTSVVIEFVKSFAIIIQKEAWVGPYINKNLAVGGRSGGSFYSIDDLMVRDNLLYKLTFILLALLQREVNFSPTFNSFAH